MWKHPPNPPRRALEEGALLDEIDRKVGDLQYHINKFRVNSNGEVELISKKQKGIKGKSQDLRDSIDQQNRKKEEQKEQW